MLGLWRRKYKKDPNKSLLENMSAEFSYLFGESIQWQWDERFNAVLLQVENKQKEKIIKIIESYFSDYWNILNAEELPQVVENLIKNLDGMTPEQLLFSTDVEQGEFVYCAWWPWKDGVNTSIRIAIYMDKLSEQAKQQRIEQVKQWFAIAA